MEPGGEEEAVEEVQPVLGPEALEEEEKAQDHLGYGHPGRKPQSGVEAGRQGAEEAQEAQEGEKGDEDEEEKAKEGVGLQEERHAPMIRAGIFMASLRSKLRDRGGLFPFPMGKSAGRWGVVY
jgi:hypothetical protein